MIYEPQSSINRKHLQNFHMRLLSTVLEKTITSVTPRYIADFATPLVLCWKTKSLTPTKLIGWVGLASQMQCAQVVLTYPNLVYFTLPLQRTEILSIYFDYKLRIYLLATTTDMLLRYFSYQQNGCCFLLHDFFFYSLIHKRWIAFTISQALTNQILSNVRSHTCFTLFAH